MCFQNSSWCQSFVSPWSPKTIAHSMEIVPTPFPMQQCALRPPVSIKASLLPSNKRAGVPQVPAARHATDFPFVEQSRDYFAHHAKAFAHCRPVACWGKRCCLQLLILSINSVLTDARTHWTAGECISRLQFIAHVAVSHLMQCLVAVRHLLTGPSDSILLSYQSAAKFNAKCYQLNDLSWH